MSLTTLLESNAIKREFTVEARNADDIRNSSGWTEIDYLADSLEIYHDGAEQLAARARLTVDLTTQSGSDELLYSDETVNANPVQSLGELRITAKFEESGGTEHSAVVFRGLIADVEPASSPYEISVTAYDKLYPLAKTTAQIDLRASSTADVGGNGMFEEVTLRKSQALSTPERDWLEVDGTQSGSKHTEAYETDGTRRAWLPGGTRLERYDGANWEEVDSDRYSIVDWRGAVELLGLKFSDFNDWRLTRVAYLYEQAIDASDPLVYALIARRSDGGPQLDDIAFETLTGTWDWTSGNPIISEASSSGAATSELAEGDRVKAPGDDRVYQVERIVDDDSVELNGVGADYDPSGYSPDWPTRSTGLLRSRVEIIDRGINRFNWEHRNGHLEDVLPELRDNLGVMPENYLLWFDPYRDRIYAEERKQAEAADISLDEDDFAELSMPREIEEVATRMVYVFEEATPDNLLDGTTTDYGDDMAGSDKTFGSAPDGTPSDWKRVSDHENRGFQRSGHLSDGYLWDGRLDTLWDIFNGSADENTYYEALDIDFTADPNISGSVTVESLRILTGPSKNTNNFAQTFRVLGTRDGTNYFDLDPELSDLPLDPLSDHEVTEPENGRVTGIKVLVKPFKWVVDGNERSIILRQLIVEANVTKEVVVAPQDTDAHGGTVVGVEREGSGTITISSGSATVSGSGTQFTSEFEAGEGIWPAEDDSGNPASTLVIESVDSDTQLTLKGNAGYNATGKDYYGAQFVSTYYPGLVGKTEFSGEVTKIVEADRRMVETEAKVQAHLHFDELIRRYQRLELRLPKPDVRYIGYEDSGTGENYPGLYSTVKVTDRRNIHRASNERLFLLEGYRLESGQLEIYGRDFNSLPVGEEP